MQTCSHLPSCLLYHACVVSKQRAGSASCWQATLDISWTSKRNSFVSASGAVSAQCGMQLAHAECTEPAPRRIVLILFF